MLNSINDFLFFIKEKIENTKVEEKYLKSTSSYNGFEKLFSDLTKDMEINNIEIKENYGHHFPDIDVIVNDVKYGIELKSRTDGSWINNGGSVFESISSQDYKEIYILFGTINKKKYETTYKVAYAPYWTVTESIKVTHKPRYFINMKTQNSIFNKKADYNKIRTMTENEKNNYVQKILRESANKPQWYITEKEEVLPTLIKDLKKSKVNELITEMLILFPHDLLITTGINEKGKSDYSRITQYLITNYFYYSPSIRDLFSAGGKFNYNNISFPKIVYQFKIHSPKIIDVLEKQSSDFKEFAYKNWSEENIEFSKTNIIEDYKTLLNHLGEKYLKETLKKADESKLTNIIF
ncbi:hypothetical protein PUW68_12175 (plasmid) [Staphylococcus haemolyticus]|nr:hypothetical protein [Staphylococcus haemolyticus]WEB19423.1 hypothetical protein PUW68_12175 [Staphylococcus haemolyticus]